MRRFTWVAAMLAAFVGWGSSWLAGWMCDDALLLGLLLPGVFTMNIKFKLVAALVVSVLVGAAVGSSAVYGYLHSTQAVRELVQAETFEELYACAKERYFCERYIKELGE